jgi:DNA-binding CsgD family transcriptional regulator
MLPGPAQLLLRAAAADAGCSLAELCEVASAVSGRAVTEADIQPAIDARLVRLDGDRLVFSHPLIAAAIYQSMTVGDRQRIHWALAHVIPAGVDRRVWHQAASVLGPDDAVAAELEALAGRADRRGAVTVSIAALDRAAGLVTDKARQADLRLRSAELAAELGRGQLALDLLARAGIAQVEPCAPAWPVPARRWPIWWRPRWTPRRRATRTWRHRCCGPRHPGAGTRCSTRTPCLPATRRPWTGSRSRWPRTPAAAAWPRRGCSWPTVPGSGVTGGCARRGPRLPRRTLSSPVSAPRALPTAPPGNCTPRARPRQQPRGDGLPQLTPQELQIAQLAARGLSSRQIGEQLFLSHRTVGSHLYHLFPKLGISTRAQLPDALKAAGPELSARPASAGIARSV